MLKRLNTIEPYTDYTMNNELDKACTPSTRSPIEVKENL